MDIYWRDAHKCPTEEEYKTMVIRSKLLLIIPVYFSAHRIGFFIQYVALCYQLFTRVILYIFVLVRVFVYSIVLLFQKLADSLV